ncbi:MAG: hypothetical protein RL346_1593 [Verrucomicrobiota bacterium]
MLLRALLPTLLMPSLILAEMEDAEVIMLRETVSKIVDVQTRESEERLQWKSRKDELAALLELHARELALLDQELAKAGNSASGHEEATSDMKSKIGALKQTRMLTSEAVARNIQRINQIAKRFPSPLRKEAETELTNLERWKPSEEPRDALRSILDVLAKAEQFNRRLTRSTEILEGREVEVLYLGLGQAFYMDRKDRAGVGQPGTDHWEWKSKPEIRSELTKALEAIDKKRTPTMVNLPLEIR